MLLSKPYQTHTCRILRFACATQPPINAVARGKNKRNFNAILSLERIIIFFSKWLHVSHHRKYFIYVTSSSPSFKMECESTCLSLLFVVYSNISFESDYYDGLSSHPSGLYIAVQMLLTKSPTRNNQILPISIFFP